MQNIVTNIWCNGNAEAVGQFYASVFPNTRSWVESRYPHEGLLDFQQSLAGEPLTVAVDLDGMRLTLINAGPEFTPNPSISLMLNFDPILFGDDAMAARAQLDAVWAAFLDGGTVLMPLQEYPFSPRFGWVQDRYGVTWQLILSDASGEVRPFVMPSLLFGGPVQDRAAEAVDYYIQVFPDAELGMRVPYEVDSGPRRRAR
ncbi:VOC family protein [Leucobacter insecticola]|uniref:VOC family protein n=1 Tax=Leucobacter insecticola TaxID=2714934 RepID=UPI003137EA55